MISQNLTTSDSVYITYNGPLNWTCFDKLQFMIPSQMNIAADTFTRINDYKICIIYSMACFQINQHTDTVTADDLTCT